MKIEGSLQEIKDFMKEFQPKDAIFSKQQLKQVEEMAIKINKKLGENYWFSKRVSKITFIINSSCWDNLSVKSISLGILEHSLWYLEIVWFIISSLDIIITSLSNGLYHKKWEKQKIRREKHGKRKL